MTAVDGHAGVGVAQNRYHSEVSAVYDRFYAGRGQDFAADAAELLAAVREHRADADSLLDVGCGTGEHLRTLQEHVGRADGLELSPAMQAIARSKVRGTVHLGDLRDFDLGARYAAVCCLTSTIGYCADLDELAGAVAAMARHLQPGGVLVVDPYWTPEQFIDGHVAEDVVRVGGEEISRRTSSEQDGRRVTHRARYRVTGPDGRQREFGHVQRLTLFTADEYLDAVRGAGLRPSFRPGTGGFAARGTYVGVARTNDTIQA